MYMVTMIVKFNSSIFLGRGFSYPYLGQTAFMGILDEITSACHVPSIRTFNPACSSLELKQQFDEGFEDGTIQQTLENATWPDRWFHPDDAWKTIYSICEALKHGDDAVIREVAGIRDELIAECRDLSFRLRGTAGMGIPFKIEIEEMEDPPQKLRDWTDNNIAEMHKQIRQALEDAGIDVHGENDDDF